MVLKNLPNAVDNKTANHGIKDPVCGMDVSKPSDERKFEYEGTTYFFCSTGCLQKFKNDPKKYFVKTEKPHAAASPTGGYT